MLRRILLALFLCVACAFGAQAQMSGVRVVTTCGNPAPWPALSTANQALASSGWLTVDTNYNLCSYPPVGAAGVAGTVAAYIQGIAGGVPVPVTGSFSSSISGFTALTRGTPISVTNVSATGNMPAGAVVVAENVGANNNAFCVLGAGPATTSDTSIPPNSWFAFTVGGSTQLSCITSSSTTTVNMTGGSGLPTGAGGGGGGGGGLSVQDAAAWTAGTSNMTPIGCEFTTGGATAIVTAHQGQVGCNTNRALLVDPSGVTSPISVASLPLPANAAIATLQPTLNLFAGTASAGSTFTGVSCAATTSAPTDTTGSNWPLSCNITGGLRVDPSGATSPISAASLPLPTGASTSANQATAATVGSTTSGQTGTMAMGAVTTTPPVYTTAQTDPLSLDVAGNLRVNCITGCSSSTNITQWASTNLGSSAVVNYGSTPAATPVIAANTFVTNTNANGQSTMANSSPVVIASDQTGIPGAKNQTPTDCSVTLTLGGTAQNAFTAQTTLHGFTIANVDTGHGAEVVWFSITGTAAAGAAGSYPLPPPTATSYAGFGSFTAPPGLGTNHALSVVAATTGHIISCTWW